MPKARTHTRTQFGPFMSLHSCCSPIRKLVCFLWHVNRIDLCIVCACVWSVFDMMTKYLNGTFFRIRSHSFVPPNFQFLNEKISDKSYLCVFKFADASTAIFVLVSVSTDYIRCFLLSNVNVCILCTNAPYSLQTEKIIGIWSLLKASWKNDVNKLKKN